MTTKQMGTLAPPGAADFVPKKSEYLKVIPTTTRYQKLVALAREYGCTWTKVAYYAIDEFLEKNPPKKS